MSEQPKPDESREQPMTSRQTYNLFTDTVTGPNVRLKDNLYQGLAILACMLLGAGIGFLVMSDGVAGALVGGFIGMVVGLLGSGIYLMIYRTVRHARGKHD